MVTLTEDFKARARKLGHSIEALERGMLIKSQILVPNIEELKWLLDVDTTPDSRRRLVKALFEGTAKVGNAEHDVSEAGILRRVEMFLYGNESLSSVDRERTASLFPMTVDAVSGTPPNPVNSEWNLGTSLGNLQVYNLTTLDMENGGYITIYNTPLQFTVQTLTRNGSAPSPYSDFNIFGATGATGGAGGIGGTGGGGRAGTAGTCKGGGGISGDDGGPGSTGTTGADGAGGFQGNPGLSSQTTQITINGLTGSASTVTIFTRSGTGGAGGMGGAGGTGGQGGQGGAGADCACEGTNGGSGGSGGAGGKGGTGGNGGSGTNAASNIVVTVPAGNNKWIIGLTGSAPGGQAGAGGAGGAGGPGGGGGSAGKHESSGKGGGTGAAGSTGSPGQPSTTTGEPGQIIVVNP